MLAYVFWHWPSPDVDIHAYEEMLIEFHSVLGENPPAGFLQSTVFKIRDAPWLETRETAYEEWYTLQDSTGLDLLNEAAVSGACEEPHNKVARRAAGGVAGLYRLRSGVVQDGRTARVATWFAKPRGRSYSEHYAQLESLTAKAGVALWGRQMTLGPTLEFCIHSPRRIALPPGCEPLEIALEPVW